MSLDKPKPAKALIVPKLPSGADRKQLIKKEGFSIILYLKRNVPYVTLHFANDSGGIHDVVLKVKGASSLEEALKVALKEIKMEREVQT